MAPAFTQRRQAGCGLPQWFREIVQMTCVFTFAVLAAAASSSSSSTASCGGLHDPCNSTTACCACEPWPHCPRGKGALVCDGASAQCIPAPPPPPWGTPCGLPPHPRQPPLRLQEGGALEAAVGTKTVRLWIGNPFGWPTGGPPDQAVYCLVQHQLEPLRDVVDEIALTGGYYLADPATGNMTNGGLLRGAGTIETVKELQRDGWKVGLMVGNIPASYGNRTRIVSWDLCSLHPPG